MLRLFRSTRRVGRAACATHVPAVESRVGAQKREDPAAPIAGQVFSCAERRGWETGGASEVPWPEARETCGCRATAATRAFNSWRPGAFVTRPKIDSDGPPL